MKEKYLAVGELGGRDLFQWVTSGRASYPVGGNLSAKIPTATLAVTVAFLAAVALVVSNVRSDSQDSILQITIVVTRIFLTSTASCCWPLSNLPLHTNGAFFFRLISLHFFFQDWSSKIIFIFISCVGKGGLSIDFYEPEYIIAE